ncbi:hypothetical protein [Gracilibacillus sp. JCM 18860]
MAQWIIDHMPKHEVYLEPYFGSGGQCFLINLESR